MAWLRQTSLRVRIAVDVVAVAVIAAVVFAAVLPSSLSSAQEIKYTGMPAPCEVLTAASLARYLPDATGKAQSGSVGTVSRVGTCNWDSETGGQSRGLSASVVVYESSTWLRDAQWEYQTFVSDESGIMGKGATVSIRPVAGLGNQAVSIVVIGHNPSPGEILAPQVGVVVQAGNADIWLNFSAAAVGATTQLTPPPPIAEQVAGTVAMARDVLASLAR